MTPLHCAAMFDHPEIAEYLILEGEDIRIHTFVGFQFNPGFGFSYCKTLGADINALDKEKRSPLLLASSRGGWRTVHSLIRLGADIHLRDVNHRNVLHVVVMNGGRLEEFAEEVNKVGDNRVAN